MIDADYPQAFARHYTLTVLASLMQLGAFAGGTNTRGLSMR